MNCNLAGDKKPAWIQKIQKPFGSKIKIKLECGVLWCTVVYCTYENLLDPHQKIRNRFGEKQKAQKDYDRYRTILTIKDGWKEADSGSDDDGGMDDVMVVMSGTTSSPHFPYSSSHI